MNEKARHGRNKYYQRLDKIVHDGLIQENKKGNIIYLLNQVLTLSPGDTNLIFAEHPIARTKLEDELALYMEGAVEVARYQEAGIRWWDYCAPRLVNTYPTYFEKLPALLWKINKEKRNSKNYMLHIGETAVDSSQAPCLSLMQFQISQGELHLTVYQRSADSNLGLPSDIYQAWLITKELNLTLGGITFFIGNAHIYENNLFNTKRLLLGEKKVKFNLNV